jgi:hypothetical protein
VSASSDVTSILRTDYSKNPTTYFIISDVHDSLDISTRIEIVEKKKKGELVRGFFKDTLYL